MLKDTTVIDEDGKIVFFSIKKFKDEVATGKCCFICGAYPSEKEFNDEHVIPEWILGRYNLFNRTILLPNQHQTKYSSYKIPCCAECNATLAKTFEDPISRATLKGYDHFNDYMTENAWRVYTWMNLLFLKTHLKDIYHRFFQDHRKPDVRIAELYDWEGIHHIHCIARTFYTKPKLNERLLGSLFVVPSLDNEVFESFDYGDLLYGMGVVVKLGDIGIIAILNDSCGSLNLYQSNLDKINVPLSTLQLREIMARMVFINLNLKERPIYHSLFKDGEYSIDAIIPEMVEFCDHGVVSLGDLLANSCVPIFEHFNNPDKEEIIDKLERGVYTFLFDEHGNFIDHSKIKTNRHQK